MYKVANREISLEAVYFNDTYRKFVSDFKKRLRTVITLTTCRVTVVRR